MNNNLIELQAKLDEAKSKKNLNGSNGDIAKLQSKLDVLKLRAELDPRTTQNLAKEIGKLINQKIVLSNIEIDQSQTVKSAQQAGKKIEEVSAQVWNDANHSAKVITQVTELLAGLKNVGGDKMCSLICFECADNNMCSLGY